MIEWLSQRAQMTLPDVVWTLSVIAFVVIAWCGCSRSTQQGDELQAWLWAMATLCALIALLVGAFTPGLMAP